MDTILMHGPALDGSGAIKEQDIEAGNVKAFEAAGWKCGPNPDKEFATVGVVYSEQDAAEQAGLAETPAEPEKPVRKAAKRK